jgi:tetratricopeptide (TPR) repeat protein
MHYRECRNHRPGVGRIPDSAARRAAAILVENARRKQSQKHGGGLWRENLDAGSIASEERHEDLLSLDESLTRFEELLPDKARLVKLRYFAGMTPLAQAYLVAGHSARLTELLGSATRDGKAEIIALAAQREGVLEQLAKSLPNDIQFQLEMARNLTARGQTALAAEKPAEALPLLEQARAIFQRLPSRPQWTVLTPTAMTSTGGETLTIEHDGSIFVSGPNPQRAAYTLKLPADVTTLTAIRFLLRRDGGSLALTLDSGITSWGHHSLGRFRISATDFSKTLQWMELLQGLAGHVVDLHMAVAKTHTQQGHLDEAVLSFAEALDLAADRDKQSRETQIIAAAAPLAGVLDKLALPQNLRACPTCCDSNDLHLLVFVSTMMF